MEKVQVETQNFSIFPIMPLRSLRLQANHFQTVEASDSWTLYYVDSGSAEIGCIHRVHHLTQSQGFVLQPGQSHHLLTFPDSSASIVQIDFHAVGREMLLLRNKRLLFDLKARKLLREIVDEAEQYRQQTAAEREPLPYTADRGDQYASQHYIQLLAEQLIIQLKRGYYVQVKEAVAHNDTTDAPTYWEQNIQRNRRYATLDHDAVTSPRNLEPTAQPETSNRQLFNRLVQYLKDRVYSSISLDELVAEFHFSKTHLSQTFKSHSGQTILTYYNILKVEEAKRLILDTDMNFSQISNALNFSSLHYFSRLFKKYTSMSPSEYQNSIMQ
ncbi:MAG: helix-turn-helix domain-containing protein [Clostridia bacterium]|nr:helix-turn-helix domain-containing protein [Clostridia bacterium]